MGGFRLDPDEALLASDAGTAREILVRPAVQEMLAWAAMQTSLQVLQIETRVQFPVFGLYAGYQLFWLWALTPGETYEEFTAQLEGGFFGGAVGGQRLPFSDDFQAQLRNPAHFRTAGLAAFVLRLAPDLAIANRDAFDAFLTLLGCCIDRWVESPRFEDYAYILCEYELSVKVKALAYLYEATPAELPRRMALNRWGLPKVTRERLLGPMYVNTFFARLFQLFHDRAEQLRFERASDALRFFRSSYPHYSALHIGFCTRKTPAPEAGEGDDQDAPNWDEEEEPAVEGGDGFDDQTPEFFYPHFQYVLACRYLPAVEAVVCHPRVAPVIEAGRVGIQVDRPFALSRGPPEGGEWEPATLFNHLTEICDACGVVDEDTKRLAVLEGLSVFIANDNKEVVGYIDVDIPNDWDFGGVVEVDGEEEEEEAPGIGEFR
jgi:hypothetical protein